MKKKMISLCLVLSLLAIAVVGGTLAYFTDTDTEDNTFTMGSVSIDLIESQYHRTNGGKGSAAGLEEPLLGGYIWAADVTLEGTPENTDAIDGTTGNYIYFSDDQIKADADTYKADYFAEHSDHIMPGTNVRKNPYIVNTGTNDTYVRARVLIPVSLFKVIDQGPSYWTVTAITEGKIVSKAVTAYLANATSFLNGTAGDYIVRRGDVDYYEFDFTYTYALGAGEMTFWNCWSNIAIDPKATADDLAGIDSFDVKMEADGIQAEGFADYEAAFTAFDN